MKIYCVFIVAILLSTFCVISSSYISVDFFLFDWNKSCVRDSDCANLPMYNQSWCQIDDSFHVTSYSCVSGSCAETTYLLDKNRYECSYDYKIKIWHESTGYDKSVEYTDMIPEELYMYNLFHNTHISSLDLQTKSIKDRGSQLLGSFIVLFFLIVIGIFVFFSIKKKRN